MVGTKLMRCWLWSGRAALVADAHPSTDSIISMPGWVWHPERTSIRLLRSLFSATEHAAFPAQRASRRVSGSSMQS